MTVYDPSSPEKDFDYYLVKYRYEILLPKFKAGSIAIELGCGTGFHLHTLSKLYDKILVVEKMQEHIEKARSIIENCCEGKILFIEDDWINLSEILEKHKGLFGNKLYDFIIFEGLEYLSLEEVEFLFSSVQKVNKNYRLHIVTSNKYSLHRRIAFYMGVLNDMDDKKNASSATSGKKWLADRYSILSILKKTNHEIIHIEPHFLKILPNKYLKSLPEDLISALFKISNELPDYCAEIYVCAYPK